MGKFAQIEDGDHARKRVCLPLLGAFFDIEKAEWVGKTVELDVRVLSPDEDIEILRLTREYARAKGVEKPAEGDPIYDYAKALYTVLFACVDTDSPQGSPARFFDSIEQIAKSKLVCQDQISYLYEQQREHQDAVAPRPSGMTQMEFLAAVVSTAGGNLDFFASLRPSMRWTFTRTLAALHIDSLKHKSLSSSDDGTSSASETGPTAPTG